MPRAVILSAVRTPYAPIMGSLAGFPAPELGAMAVRGALARAGLEPGAVEALFLGNVHSHPGRGNPAGAVLKPAGLKSAAAQTFRAGCVSGLAALVAAADAVISGRLGVVVAGGMESNSQAPHLAPGFRKGLRLGGGKLLDPVRHDGPDARPAGGESTPAAYLAAFKNRLFEEEILPVEIPATRKRPAETLDLDEAAGRLEAGELPVDGEPPPLADGAAALVIASEDWAKEKGLRSLAVATPCGASAGEYEKAVRDARFVEADLTDPGRTRLQELAGGGGHPGLNTRGGAMQMGHAAGADGARLAVSLVHMLRGESGGRGLALAFGAWGESAGLVIDHHPSRTS